MRRVLVVVVALLGCKSDAPGPSAGSGSTAVVRFQGNTTTDLEAWKQQCDQGTVGSCELLANQYGLSTDPALVTRSVIIFETACGHGSMLGCYAAGEAYLDGGNGVPKDEAKGLALLHKGCDLGHHWACERLDRAR